MNADYALLPDSILETPTFQRRVFALAKKAASVPWHIALLTRQQADGSFALTDEILEAAQISSRKAKALLKESGLDESVFATALAVFTLRSRAPELIDTWRAAVDKATAVARRYGSGNHRRSAGPVAGIEARQTTRRVLHPDRVGRLHLTAVINPTNAPSSTMTMGWQVIAQPLPV